MFRSARACLDLRGRTDSAHGYVILCAQCCKSLARCVHALAMFCPTFNAIRVILIKYMYLLWSISLVTVTWIMHN